MTQLKSLLLLIVVSLALRPAASLSDTVCVNTAATWVSDSPRLIGQFPFYNFLFFCEGELNLGSVNVDACVNNGLACGQPAADEFCQFLGFEACAADLYTTLPAVGPARSMTGEWCVEENRYEDFGYLNRTQLDAVTASVNGTRTPCQRLDSVVCYNSREQLAINNHALHAVAHPPVQAEPEVVTVAAPSPSQAAAGISPIVEIPSSNAVGGRKLLL
ncbi:hypothetical protein WJX73_010905 [Symbiochloris irregularis]|uniref:Uncharacterized protein n=1 Tax=Symbiochloris irregularis TaxID=706552 RepID=A0AAW1PN40_9CHLO